MSLSIFLDVSEQFSVSAFLNKKMMYYLDLVLIHLILNQCSWNGSFPFGSTGLPPRLPVSVL